MKARTIYSLQFALTLLLLSFMYSCEKRSCKNPITVYEESGHSISIEESKVLYDNYNRNLKKSIREFQLENLPRENNEYQPTQYVLININTMRCYLDFLEEIEKKNKNCKENKEISGIAIFLGARAKDAKLENKKGYFNKQVKTESKTATSSKDIRGRLTLYMAPTYRDDRIKNVPEVQKHVPFYIQPDNEEDKYIGEYKSLLQTYNLENFMKQNTQGNQARYLFSNTMATSTKNTTSTILEEFTDVPPESNR